MGMLLKRSWALILSIFLSGGLACGVCSKPEREMKQRVEPISASGEEHVDNNVIPIKPKHHLSDPVGFKRGDIRERHGLSVKEFTLLKVRTERMGEPEPGAEPRKLKGFKYAAIEYKRAEEELVGFRKIRKALTEQGILSFEFRQSDRQSDIRLPDGLQKCRA